MRYNFKEGDYVQAIRDGSNYKKGAVCRVKGVFSDSRFLRLTDLSSGEDYGGCRIENFVPYRIDGEIRIYRDPVDPRKTVAERVHTGEKGISRCAPEDTYDFYTGAKLALERLEKKQNNTEYRWNGKIVCVDQGKSRFFTTGKVYSVKNGELFDDSHRSYTSRIFHSFNEVDQYMKEDNSMFSIKMIEFKGE